MSLSGGPDLSAVPLFPLPNVVLFPRAVLPLHIFEERYKAMTADVLEGDKLIAMALLRPGWEKNYHGRPAIEPVVCVGEILSWERLEDGRYNFLLQGRLRARVESEQFLDPYRVAALAPLVETPVLEIDLEPQRRRMMRLFSGPVLRGIPVARQFESLLASEVPCTDLADLAAFNLLEDVELKQQLLGETDVRRRVERTVQALEEWGSHQNPAIHGLPADPGLN